ncbi:MAG: C4-dicarboxylate ABC transporter substrate-binding protein [Betaproteobacteria bacterium HGW-Betaproteobacteria-18]|nr:MAG: C4-dicarboxylate ABC transporter substrate-binding protein [Betaproteobacteria bacterium HGW-Betaproteobacteria-18]
MKKFIQRVVVGLIGSGALAVAASAAELRFNNPLPETRPETKELAKFAEDVAKNSGGVVTIKLHNGGSLGIKDADVLQVLPKGAVDMSLIWANYVSRDAPALGIVLVQGSIGTVEELKRALPVVRQIYDDELKDWGITATGYLAIPMLEASIFCRDQPIKSLAELKSKKLRVWSKEQVASFKRLGIAAQIIGQADMYVAMKTGVVDCAVYPALYAHTVNMHEVAKYGAFLYPMPSGPYALGIATTKWNALPQEQRSAITKAAEDTWNRTNEYSADHQRELAAREELKKKGVNWLGDFPEADRKQFLDAVSATWAELATEAGGKAPGYRERVLKAMGR